jgi:sialate O-acetylesterase
MRKLNFKTMACCIVLIMTGLQTSMFGQLKTSSIFTNGMVLQREKEIPVWGYATADASVSVSLNGVSASVTADNNGKWLVKLSALPAGGPYTMEIKSGTETITRTDVYIGDVWFASGQSNMALKLSNCTGGAAEAASSNNQLIREFEVPTDMGSTPVENLTSGSWTPATAANAGNFSGTAYYFAKNIQADLNIPIGIINASKGGARIEAYMSDEMLGFDESTVTLASGEAERQPTQAFNTQINPLVGYGIKGFIWYQGESNADNLEDAVAYADLFKRMITAWRGLWGLGDVPFLWVQLPNEGTVAVENTPAIWDAWPKLRACQSRALSLPNTGQAVIIDAGEVDIHPKDKKTVGERLARVARKVAYAEDIVAFSPKYKNYTVLANGHIQIDFNNIGSGLNAKGAVNDSIRWFSMAGADGVLYKAKAVLANNRVEVWCDKVAEPQTIRYAWECNPTGVNLYSNENLPAEPFLIHINRSSGFGEYVATSSTIERGKSTVLKWETNGASSTTLNGAAVDSTGGIMVWPKITTDYKLSITSNIDGGVKDSTLTIKVIDPLPTISISSSLGELVSPDSTVVITAKAAAGLGYTVTKVDFYVDGVLTSSASQSPYTMSWKSTTLGEYKITAVVTDNNNSSVTSNSLSILVAKLKLQKYEAENASFTGKGSVKSSKAASGGKYMDMTDGWELSFSPVNVEEAGDYYLSIRYLLNYQSPKTQNLNINGAFYQAVVFTAPNTSTWMTTLIKVPLNAGDNVIAIEGSWNWMSFDYIAMAVKDNETDTTKTDLDMNLKANASLVQVAPNPFNVQTNISYTVPQSGKVQLGVYTITGQLVTVLVNEAKPAGTYTCSLNAENLPKGIYLVRIQGNGFVESKKIVCGR